MTPVSQDPSLPAARGRHAGAPRRMRTGLTAVLAVLLPLATIGSLLLVGSPPEATPARGPEEAPLPATTLVCPAAEAPGEATVAAAHVDPEAGGGLQRTVPDRGEVGLRPGRVVTTTGSSARGPWAVVARDELAPGPVAGRWDAAGVSRCGRPQPETWVTGLSAGPERATTLRLTNPDLGPAVADVTVLGERGPLDSSRLRGVRVAGGGSVTLDLAELVPTRDDVAAQVVVSRGRLGVSAVDSVDRVGAGRVQRSRVPTQATPTTRSWLMGLQSDDEQQVLHVANPGSDEVRLDLRVVTGRSEVAPAGLEEVRVAPGSVESVPLTDALGGDAARDATGLRVDASGPVAASVRGVRGGSIVTTVPGAPVEGTTAAVLPGGPARLLLAGASALGTAQVTVRDARGTVVDEQRVEVDPGRSVEVDLPATGRVVVVEVDKTAVSAALVVERPRPDVVPLPEIPLTGQVPDVRPALD